jgi:hypothetical protein
VERTSQTESKCSLQKLLLVLFNESVLNKEFYH